MAQVKVVRAEAFEGPAVQYQGDDGYPAAYVLPVLVAKGLDGKLYQRPNVFKVDYDDDGFQFTKVDFDLSAGRRIADKICERGFIDGDYWVEVTQADLQDYIRGGYGWDGQNVCGEGGE